MGERLVLTLDGATRVCSAALLRPRVLASPHEGPGSLWQVVASRSYDDARGQGRILLAAIDDMLREMECTQSDVGAIVVGTGPGTFTGVRIAVATARALSLALHVPVTGVSTLAALASSVAHDERVGTIVPAVDARRGQLFFGLYRDLGGPEIQRWARRAPYGVCDRGTLGEMIEGSALVVAEDRALVGELPQGVEFRETPVQAERLVFGQGLLIEPGELPQGIRLTPWLIETLVAGRDAEPERVKPIYVRSPDADIHITKMRDPFADTPGTGAGKRRP